MLTYYNSQNQPVKLLKELGRGGEGAVYASEDETLVGKIYHAAITYEKAEKLLWMAAHRTDQLLKTTAWIAEVLKDQPDGKVVGFLMPKIKAKEIHELYAPKSRRIHYPDATWHFLIHTAMNLARAFHNLHKDGHVMGDVNQGNCVVTHDGTVKLIDCDSYGIKTQNRSYSCEVGVTTHIPPELQGKNLRTVERTENHDNFGLAVIIFQLLFLGRHPFSGNYLGAEDKTLEDAIREHLFVYGKDAERKKVVRPPGTLPLSAVSPPVAELFERAFAEENKRPKPREWVETLEVLAENLQQCLLNPGHLYYSKFSSEFSLCPWCEIEGNTGLMLFPFTVSTGALSHRYERDFDVTTIEKLIQSFNISSLPAKLSDEFPVMRVSPSQEVIRERRRLDKMLKVSIGISPLLLVFSYFVNVPLLMYLAFVIVVNKFLFEDTAGKELRKKEREKLAEMELQYDYLESIFSKTAQTSGLNQQLFQIQQALGEYGKLETDFENSDKNPDEKSPVKDLLGKQMQRAETKITELLVSLRSASVEIRRQQQKLFAQSKDSLKDLVKARANVDHLGYKFLSQRIPYEHFPQGILIGSLAIFAFLPAFSVSEDKPKTFAITEKPTPYGFAPPSQAAKAPALINIPSESITDQEIAALPANRRSEIIGELLRKANLSAEAYAHNDARKLLKFAQRFDKFEAGIPNLFGKVAYNSGEYKEAARYFETAKKLKPEKVDEFYAGMTYVQLKKYREAKDIFSKLNAKQPTVQSLYNLGAANIGLKDYKAAAENFQTALRLSPGDADSLYQLGICLNNLGDAAGVRQTYATLEALNSSRAEKLRKAVSKSVKLSIPTDNYPSSGVGRGMGGGTGNYSEDAPPPLRR